MPTPKNHPPAEQLPPTPTAGDLTALVERTRDYTDQLVIATAAGCISLAERYLGNTEPDKPTGHRWTSGISLNHQVDHFTLDGLGVPVNLIRLTQRDDSPSMRTTHPRMGQRVQIAGPGHYTVLADSYWSRIDSPSRSNRLRVPVGRETPANITRYNLSQLSSGLLVNKTVEMTAAQLDEPRESAEPAAPEELWRDREAVDAVAAAQVREKFDRLVDGPLPR